MPPSRSRASAVPRKKQRKGRNAQWAAQFAVASELCKLGYEVAFTLGHNTPLADLMVINPRRQHFLIDVKGLSAKNVWIVKKKRKRFGLYYILALVPRDKQNEFFVLTQHQANGLIARNHRRASRRTRPAWDGFLFSAAAPYREKWCTLPR